MRPALLLLALGGGARAAADCAACLAAGENCYHPTWDEPCSNAANATHCTESSTNAQWCSGPAPPPPAPTPPPAPAPPPPPAPAGDVIGYWDATWAPVAAPAGANIGVAFGGWADPQQALDDAAPVKSSLVGAKWVDLGGGNANGRFGAADLAKAAQLIAGGSFAGWAGVVLDVEECDSAGLAGGFADVLAAAKKAGMGTMVTVSHSAPYNCADATTLMQAFFASRDIDYLSPQLYTSGNEAAPDFATDPGAPTWADWSAAKAAVVPSIGSKALAGGGYAATQTHFAQYNIKCKGYVVWPSDASGLRIRPR